MSGTTISAVTECDLFFRLSMQFSCKPTIPEQRLGVAGDQRGPPGHVRVEPLDQAVIQRQDVVLGRLDEEQPLQLAQLVRLCPDKSWAWVKSVVPS